MREEASGRHWAWRIQRMRREMSELVFDHSDRRARRPEMTGERQEKTAVSW